MADNKKLTRRRNGYLTKSEEKLMDFLMGKIREVAHKETYTKKDIQALESLGAAAIRLADLLESETIEGEMDEARCAMFVQALGEAASSYAM